MCRRAICRSVGWSETKGLYGLHALIPEPKASTEHIGHHTTMVSLVRRLRIHWISEAAVF